MDNGYYNVYAMDITNYFCISEGDELDGRALSSTTLKTSQACILGVAR